MNVARAVGLAALLAAVPAAAGEQRLVSINMCTDQLLLDLAQPPQIIGLSPFARDAVRSWAVDKVGHLPILSGTAEEIMVLRPTAVLAGSFTRRATREFIRARGVPLEEFDVAQTVSQTKEQIGRVARLVGAEALGQERVAALDAAFEKLRSVGRGKRLRVLPLARRGWVAGRETLLSELLTAAGLLNVADDAGLRSGGFLSLEAIVRLEPDAILISQEDGVAEDQGRALLLHPAIQRLFPPERRIILPESLTVCGGPMLVEAMQRLAVQIARLEPRIAVGR